MQPTDLNRRNFVAAMVGGAAASFIRLHWDDIERAGALAARTAQDAPYVFLTPDQVREFDAITSTIVPTDDTPGAHEAHVVRFIDNALATFWKPRQPMVAPLLQQIGALVEKRTPGSLSFAKLGEADRVAVLEEFEKTAPGFFNQLRNVTLTGLFAYPDHGGNFDKIGWKLIGFEDRYSWTPPFGYYDRA